MGKHVYYYHSLNDDVVTNRGQDYHLPADYVTFPANGKNKLWSAVVRPASRLISMVYVRLIRRIRVVGKDKLRTAKGQGCFIYGNHTQVFGDVVLPLSIMPASSYYALAAESNWGIPILGKLILPYFGLPVGQSIKQAGKLLRAVKHVIDDRKAVVIYPEAHVWPYYTKIRPFPATSMHFPVMLQVPSFSMTTTYSRPRWGKRPRITVYVDGPFYPDRQLTQKQAQKRLHAQIYSTMQTRARLNNYDYYAYQQTPEEI
ncbi:1-acyl-sn-glycerol-3-phosphate acyltransferase [Lactobacillus sp. XV13L]|nr:1-acyl-sn-glycerol-3-phosphate acyltransferase [Lactobacillus sp. XV13L]